MTVNYDIIIENGFQYLQEALNFNSVIYGKFCPSCKQKQQMCKRTLNAYIYIELDVKLITKRDGRECQLSDFPACLNLIEDQLQISSEKKELTYRWVFYESAFNLLSQGVPRLAKKPFKKINDKHNSTKTKPMQPVAL